jgi:uncharacterized membrane protein
MHLLALLQDTIADGSGASSLTGALTRFYAFVQPYQFYIVAIIVLWLVARRPGSKKEDFNRQAQDVLEEKYRRGEISRKAYEKYRQDISLRPRR